MRRNPVIADVFIPLDYMEKGSENFTSFTFSLHPPVYRHFR